MKLHLGKMTSAELAKWFNIGLKTYQNTRRKRLEELEDYAEFMPFRGGVEIEEIWIEEYQSKAFKDDELYLKELADCNSGLGSIAGMVRNLEHKKALPKDTSARSLERRLSKARNRLFGNPSDKETDVQEKKAWSKGGQKGKNRYVWAVKESEYNKYRFMTKEERDVFYAIISQHYTPEVIATSKLITVPEDGQSKEDFEKEKENSKDDSQTDFFAVLKEFKDKMNIQLVKATEHMVLTSMERAQEERRKKLAW